MKKITNLTLAGLLLSRQKLGNEEDIGISKWNIEHKNRAKGPIGFIWDTKMAAISLFWNTKMAAVTSDENALYISLRSIVCALWDIESLELDRRPLGPKARVAFYLIRGTLYPIEHK